jgi:hypothetical protein
MKRHILGFALFSFILFGFVIISAYVQPSNLAHRLGSDEQSPSYDSKPHCRKKGLRTNFPGKKPQAGL